MPAGSPGCASPRIGCLTSLAAEEDLWIITLILRPQRHCQMSARRRQLSAIFHEGAHAATRASDYPSFVDGNHT